MIKLVNKLERLKKRNEELIEIISKSIKTARKDNKKE
jgi:hypothetical protein